MKQLIMVNNDGGSGGGGGDGDPRDVSVLVAIAGVKNSVPSSHILGLPTTACNSRC